ncbi:hypothetical protein GCM10007209_21110 [Haloferax sulfurifontis]|uniref:Uncharacterized protein n=1 Tax=Haloferax sulfurifontis TaxID=255616 RepID=A0A830DTP8_9EURY|nr:hypothetical protein GCM10007209_21110 [Haloferax sulfurifontis]
MYGTLARIARDEPETAILGVESLLAAGVLLGVALTLVSPLASALPLAHVGFTLAAAATLLLTVVSLWPRRGESPSSSPAAAACESRRSGGSSN